MSESIVFDRAANFYDDTRGFPPGAEHDIAVFIAHSAGLTAEARVLEIGVGTGRIALPLAQRTGSYTGVDLSVAMMDRLRAKQPQYSQRVRLVQGDVTRLPVASASFDAVIAVHIFHLVSDQAAAAQETLRVVRAGGKAVHCWNQRGEDGFKPLISAWEAVTTRGSRGEARGASWKVAQTVLDDNGWVRQEDYATTIITHQSAYAVAQRYRDRVWSSMWGMPDDLYEAGLAAVEAALLAHYPDPHAPVPAPITFNARVYRHPEG